MVENERQQRLVERIQEDERLRGDLSDQAATTLVAWATEHTLAASADVSRSDHDVEAAVQAIRAAAHDAARSGLTAAHEIVALADATLAQHTAPPPAPAITVPPTPRPRWFGRVRRRVGERIRRWLERKDS